MTNPIGKAKDETRGSVRSVLLPSGVVETTMRGRISREMVVQAFDELDSYPRSSVWIVDMTKADSYEAAALAAATERLIASRRRGLEKLVAVTPSPMLRMAASVVRVGSGFPLVIVETRAEALAHLG
jgi:hypothetical protein